MKLKYYIVLGYFISTLITIITVAFAVEEMFVTDRDAYILMGITVVASIGGVLFSLLLLSKVFVSLDKLKDNVKKVKNKKFEPIEIQTPSEFKELADAYNEMTRDLEITFDSLAESEREKNLMIAQLSHDIKTPLTSIQGTVEGMLDGLIADSEKEQYLKIIKRQTKRLNNLVEELNYLTLNIANYTEEESKKDLILVDKLLIDILSEHSILIEREEREINIDITPESAKFYSDRHKLERILANIIGNALKYSKPKTDIYIFASVTGKKFQLSVKDEGQGIKEENIKHIFKRLYREEQSRNMKTGGYGLGLYIASQLAKQLNGNILVDSIYGKGSTFTLVIDLD